TPLYLDVMSSPPQQTSFADNSGTRTNQPTPVQSNSQTGSEANHETTYFRVLGTNRSINQRVVFSGALVGNNNMLSNSRYQAQAQSSNLRSLPSSQNNSLQNLFQNIRVSGKAKVGDGAEMDVDAQPSSK